MALPEPKLSDGSYLFSTELFGEIGCKTTAGVKVFDEMLQLQSLESSSFPVERLCDYGGNHLPLAAMCWMLLFGDSPCSFHQLSWITSIMVILV